MSLLVREYREVGEAIAVLQARQGEPAARRFRERYFRLPYGDALRIPAVRRDALAELAHLRHEVMLAIRPASGAVPVHDLAIPAAG